MGATEREEQTSTAWWVDGDFPVRQGCRADPLVDGHRAMLAMCRSFLSAREYILLAGWDLHTELPMVRGDDLRQVAQDIEDEPALDEEAQAFWRAGRLRVVDVLGFAARRGVRVGVLLWDAFHLGSHLTNDPTRQRDRLAQAGVDCLLDDSSRQVRHITQALHQKCAVVDGRVAYVGGIDLTIAEGGDFDRWDTHRHPCATPERLIARRPSAHPWHDVHCRLQGPLVGDVLRNIVQRWGEVAQRHEGPTWPQQLTQETGTADANGYSAQVVRTIPSATYRFAPGGITGIKEQYLRALAMARSFVYIENQYLWPEVFRGMDRLQWGGRSPDMADILEAMAGALARGVHLALVLPDHPNCGRRFTDGGIMWLRQRAARTGASERLHVFTLGASDVDAEAPGGVLYRPVYTHAKIAVVDDLWWTAGSANLNSRGMRSDAELNVAVLDPATARQLRLILWREHTESAAHSAVPLDEPLAGLAELEALAGANRERVRKREHLQGHLLPYCTVEDGRAWRLPVHAELGWLDNLEGGAGEFGSEHAGRYL
jgi:phosphatidylserine/phosphatidylglycerophosphate/cardiolipin synthase-like enzyme